MSSTSEAKTRLLNGPLAAALASLRHGETIFVADAGMGLDPTALRPLPAGKDRVDLGIAPGVPSLADLLPAMDAAGDIEAIIVADKLREENPGLFAQLQDIFSGRPIHEVPYYPNMYDLRDRAKVVVQTGDYGLLANVVLIGGYPSPDIPIEILTADDPMGTAFGGG